MKLAHCNKHIDSAEHGLACYKIRHADGRPATPDEVWGEIERLRKTLQQVLVDAQSQDVLFEWWTPIEIALTPNVVISESLTNTVQE